MNEAAQTIEGWYALHDFYSVDWRAWKAASKEERETALVELKTFIHTVQAVEDTKEGSSIIYSIVGQKADFMFMHLRETLEELNDLEMQFNKTALASFLKPAYSYVSIVELSNYLAKSRTGTADPAQSPELLARLKPILPRTKHVCFYPMNKRRAKDENWYMLDMEVRRKMMHSHGMIGRSYAGIVRQIITGSVGLDDWEWGVTLFSDEALQFKKLVYEMRFDEVSAIYAEFGAFYVGNIADADSITAQLALD